MLYLKRFYFAIQLQTFPYVVASLLFSFTAYIHKHDNHIVKELVDVYLVDGENNKTPKNIKL